eukprot:2535885-Pyramimonas_sp.AAC.1
MYKVRPCQLLAVTSAIPSPPLDHSCQIIMSCAPPLSPPHLIHPVGSSCNPIDRRRGRTSYAPSGVI